MKPQRYHEIIVTVNGKEYAKEVDSRKLLVDFIREDIGLTGSHIGCDTSNCGACTMMLDGTTVKSCTVFAVKANGRKITTIEGVAKEGEFHPIQQAFHEHHALQCGYCTPGMIMSSLQLLAHNRPLSEEEVRKGMAGNICRCTGYHNIVQAVMATSRGEKKKVVV